RLAGKRPGAVAAGLALGFDGAALRDHPPQFGAGDVDQVEEMPHAVGAHPAAPCAAGCWCFLASRSQARSMRCTASATSSSVTISGGSSRTTLSPAATVSIF